MVHIIYYWLVTNSALWMFLYLVLDHEQKLHNELYYYFKIHWHNNQVNFDEAPLFYE